jgi:hypothetical protein
MGSSILRAVTGGLVRSMLGGSASNERNPRGSLPEGVRKRVSLGGKSFSLRFRRACILSIEAGNLLAGTDAKADCDRGGSGDLVREKREGSGEKVRAARTGPRSGERFLGVACREACREA